MVHAKKYNQDYNGTRRRVNEDRIDTRKKGEKKSETGIKFSKRAIKREEETIHCYFIMTIDQNTSYRAPHINRGKKIYQKLSQ